MKKTILSAAVAVLITLFSCSKDNNNSSTPVSNKREVRYELSGNYSGSLKFIYSNESFGYNELIVSTFPKSVSITYPVSISACTANGLTDAVYGKSGETLTLKIYSGGTLVKTVDANTNSAGSIQFPNWGVYSF